MTGHRQYSTKAGVRLMLSMFTIVAAVLLLFQSTYSSGVQSERKQEIKEHVERILGSEEFIEKEHKKTFIETLAVGVKEIVESIKEKVKQLMAKMKLRENRAAPRETGLDPQTSALLKLIGILVIIAASVFTVFIISRNFRTVKKIKQKEDRELLLAIKDADLVEEKACQYADKGDYRQGIRYLYIALLLKFNEFNLIRIEKSKTNKQYLNELRTANFGSFEKVSDFTHDFNRYWYGNRRADKEAFEYWKKCYDLLKKEVTG